MPSINLLNQLPEELLQEVIDRLEPKKDLYALNLTSRWANAIATPRIWRDVELVDCRTRHLEEGAPCGWDDHDDRWIIRKLIILATKPSIASCVHTLTHRCHLPPPAIFNELPHMPFASQTLSSDPRTIALVKLAVRNLSNVQTLRIILGHPNLTDAILRCCFDRQREKQKPITRLWLENCRISAGCCASWPLHPHGLPAELDMTGLQSVRFRRMPLRCFTTFSAFQIPGFGDTPNLGGMVYSRGGAPSPFCNGQGGQYLTNARQFLQESYARNANRRQSHMLEDFDEKSCSPEELFAAANCFDDQIYEAIEEECTLPLEILLAGEMNHSSRALLAHREWWPDPPFCTERIQDLMTASLSTETDDTIHLYKVSEGREILPSLAVAQQLLGTSSSTLRSLSLDWVFTEPRTAAFESHEHEWTLHFLELFSLRFPQLRAFQLRNAVVPDGLLPPGLYLLDRVILRPLHETNTSAGLSHCQYTRRALRYDAFACIEFMEYHSKLQCLGWSMDSFFSEHPMPPALWQRIDAIIENLGRSLEDLRIDAMYTAQGELKTEDFRCEDIEARSRRRRFVSLFAAKMKKLRSVKIEGGIPRDERREIMRALHNCPLEKAVMIGVNWPLGNTWGRNAQDLSGIVQSPSWLEVLEAEDKDTIFDLGSKAPMPVSADFKFEACYGWPPSAPMLHTMASFHAKTIKELKFCGYQGSPALLSPTPITKPMLSALKCFDNLESVIFSMLLSTIFEGQPRDNAVIGYWLDARTPASTALVLVSDDEPEGWERELRTKYAPDAVAWRVTNFIGPYLSEKAKAKKAGVHVRASFCVGDGGLFDLDCGVGKGAVGSDVCLWHKGPREELDPERRRGKLEARRWF